MNRVVNRKLRWLVGALLMLALPLAFAAGQQPPSPAHWRTDIDAFVAHDRSNPPPQHGVLFIGSSSIRFWAPTLAGDFPGVPVIDRGFGGSAIADSTYYADRIVVPYHPALIVMYAGDNDIAEGLAPAQVAAHFRAFVARVRHDLPQVPVAFVSIKPSRARWSLWPRMRAANRLIRQWAATQHDVTYVDVATRMLHGQGRPSASLFRPDGLHMTPAGYAIWIAALKPVLAHYGFPPRPAHAAAE
ncbi:SGNH/GDSL hydrolase family protein [Dyella sp. A6]|uniref:SGNH/GDSL hydrolase family protein n=1 Tax=Dyella aluminiiresistens TaxID=3069105 RepID=UPI002E76A6CC|nr:SGNH/GDSL hydrolase family protein [Dyella sp. A6]